MITRFRLEATGQNKEKVEAELARNAKRIIFNHSALLDEWEVTDDVISKNANGTYQGRVVYKLKGGD